MTRTPFIAITVLCALCSCSSHKSASGQEVTLTGRHMTADSVSAGTKSRQLHEVISALCDSVALTFTADSIITPDVVIYGPSVSVAVVEPSVGIEKSETTVRADSVCQRIEKKDSVATFSNSVTGSDTVAVTKPPDSTLIISLCLVFIGILFFIIFALRKSKKRD